MHSSHSALAEVSFQLVKLVSVLLLGPKAPSHKMQSVCFYLSSSSVSNFRDCAVRPLLRHCFAHAKWPTLACLRGITFTCAGAGIIYGVGGGLYTERNNDIASCSKPIIGKICTEI